MRPSFFQRRWIFWDQWWQEACRAENILRALKLCPLSPSELLAAHYPPNYAFGNVIATSPGVVIQACDLAEILYYPPRKEPHKRPMVIAPSWINKFYILDLGERDSLIRWLTHEGFPVYTLSWRNFTSPRSYGLWAYVDAVAQALHVARNMWGGAPHGAGYCAGGFLMHYAASLVQQRQGWSPQSISYLASLIDTRHMGPLELLLRDFWPTQPLIPASMLRMMFLHLRPREALWGTIKRPQPLSPLTWWSDDAIAMPLPLYRDSIDFLTQGNALVKGLILPGPMQGITPDYKGPSFCLGALKDAICPWISSYYGAYSLRGKTVYVLTDSGHVSSIINAPKKKKYGFWHDVLPNFDKKAKNHELWQCRASYHKGSWWPFWSHWLEQQGGDGNTPRNKGFTLTHLGQEYLKASLVPAPGYYVRQMS